MPTVDELIERYGYSREEAEREWGRAHCTHEYARIDGGTLCVWSAFGCYRTCVKCGQKTVDTNHCGQYDARKR